MAERICSIPDCDKIVECRGWCPMHYQRWRINGDPLIQRLHPPRRRKRVVGVEPCSVDGCKTPVKAKGWCAKHYSRWQRHGDVDYRLPGEIRDGRRICALCGVDKLLDDYTRDRDSWCRACATRNMRMWRRENPKPRVPTVPRECEVCGTVFGANKKRSRYCSSECALANKNKANWIYLTKRRARLREALVEPFERIDIFTRDGWVCQICGDYIIATLRAPHPDSPSIDHRIPIARGGTHEPSNAQAAHLLCNVIKADKIT